MTTRPTIHKAAWQRTRRLVLARDGNRCHYCGGVADTADHIIPPSPGQPRDELSNLVAACSTCNKSKGRKTLRQWSGPSAEPQPVTVYAPRRRPTPPPATAVDRGFRYSFAVHVHAYPDGFQQLVGDYGFDPWTGAGCPPGCTLPRR